MLAASTLYRVRFWKTSKTWLYFVDTESSRMWQPQGRVRVVYTGWSQLLLGLCAGGIESPLSSGEA